MDPYAKNEVRQTDRPEGVLWQSTDLRSRIWVKTWSLNHSADRDASLEYLKKTYARMLQGVESPEEQAEVTDSEAENTAEPASSKLPR